MCDTILRDSELFTTSGVLVKNSNGDKRMTVASQEFPFGREIVHHPSATYEPVGVVEKIFGETVISLARLHKNIKYASQTFGSSTQSPTQITSLMNFERFKVGDILNMENPFSWYCAGTLVNVTWLNLPVDKGREELPWVIFMGFYFGNGPK